MLTVNNTLNQKLIRETIQSQLREKRKIIHQIHLDNQCKSNSKNW